MIKYFITAKKDIDVFDMHTIIGGATRKLAIEAFETYNRGEKWNSKYGGARDFKVIKMKFIKIKK